MSKISNLKAVLFDMDGTIFDSESLYSQAWVASAQHFNQHFTHQMYQDFVGVRSVECYQIAQKMFGEDFDMEPFIRFFREYISAEKAQKMPIKSGFTALFESLKQSGLKLGLVTSARHASILENFAHLSYLADFDVVISGDDVKNAKPDPECYQTACQKLNIEPQQALVFEDSNPGALAAINAGCQTVIIPDLLPIEDHIEKQAFRIFDNLSQVQHSLF